MSVLSYAWRAVSFVSVSMMQVRSMRVPMFDRVVRVAVSMLKGSLGRQLWMLVVVVPVGVAMAVLVLKTGVSVPVTVPFP